MSAARFRPPTKHRPPQREVLARWQRKEVARVARLVETAPLPGVHAAEPMVPTPLRRSRKGLVNVKRKQQAAIRRDLKRKREVSR